MEKLALGVLSLSIEDNIAPTLGGASLLDLEEGSRGQILLRGFRGWLRECRG